MLYSPCTQSTRFRSGKSLAAQLQKLIQVHFYFANLKEIVMKILGFPSTPMEETQRRTRTRGRTRGRTHGGRSGGRGGDRK